MIKKILAWIAKKIGWYTVYHFHVVYVPDRNMQNGEHVGEMLVRVSPWITMDNHKDVRGYVLSSLGLPKGSVTSICKL